MHDRVVVAVDPRSTGTRAVEEAAVLARSHGAELVIVVAYPNQMTTRERLAKEDAPFDQQWSLSAGSLAEGAARSAVERARRYAGEAVRIRTRCEPGRPAAVLTELSNDLRADLVVVELSAGHGPSAITPRVVRHLERKAHGEVVVVTDTSSATHPVPAVVPGAEPLPA